MSILDENNAIDFQLTIAYIEIYEQFFTILNIFARNFFLKFENISKVIDVQLDWVVLELSSLKEVRLE